MEKKIKFYKTINQFMGMRVEKVFISNGVDADQQKEFMALIGKDGIIHSYPLKKKTKIEENELEARLWDMIEIDYRNDWSVLMPVLIKISQLGMCSFSVHSNRTEITVRLYDLESDSMKLHETIIENSTGDLINNAYHAACKFIDKYKEEWRKLLQRN